MNPVALFIVKNIADNKYDIDDPADSAKTAGEHPDKTAYNFSGVKSVYSEFAEKNYKNQRYKP